MRPMFLRKKIMSECSVTADEMQRNSNWYCYAIDRILGATRTIQKWKQTVKRSANVLGPEHFLNIKYLANQLVPFTMFG